MLCFEESGGNRGCGRVFRLEIWDRLYGAREEGASALCMGSPGVGMVCR